MAKRDRRLRERFGQVLRDRRTARGLSQEELAHRSSLDISYISLLERGLRSPTLETLVALADALELEPEELVASIRQG